MMSIRAMTVRDIPAAQALRSPLGYSMSSEDERRRYDAVQRFLLRLVTSITPQPFATDALQGGHRRHARPEVRYVSPLR